MTSVIGFTAGFLLACAIFRSRRAPMTPDEVRASEMRRFYRLAQKKLVTPLFYEDKAEREQRMGEHLAAITAARELESKK